ncbi:hypothetical protein EUX98_g7042 [Antrodiella citrinella]|uniref:Transmembrane protein n=1 Tax=Antrodiella citrinella TaxID=2447956 RepID=A0A4V3XHY3_9APHY|nr:hypothetical protein EUX98_g7042 [Antrodiella citrinella]
MDAATAVASPLVVSNNTQPPIVYFLQLLQQVLSASVALVVFVARTASSILSPISIVSSSLLYLFAPVLVLANILLDVFLVTPFHIIVYLLHALYPIYVLVGIAFICACFVGLAARLSIHLLKSILLRSPSVVQPPSVHVTQPEEDEKPRRKAQKRVSIKEEK